MSAAAAALGDIAGRPVIVVLARRKDQHILLEALATVERPVVVAFVGIEPDDQLRAVAARLPPRHRVVYVPFTDQPLAFYRLGTIAALPSRIEGLSLALLEGMALGLPVVASRAGGNPVSPGGVGAGFPPARDPPPRRARATPSTPPRERPSGRGGNPAGVPEREEAAGWAGE